jgi:hypothetical protein
MSSIDMKTYEISEKNNLFEQELNIFSYFRLEAGMMKNLENLLSDAKDLINTPTKKGL